ncbi:MAG: hypothetical protein IJW63_01515 [Lachnospiraceae bacterium]|nr:hypothetical protein [Lachnospiraceae bacterium]
MIDWEKVFQAESEDQLRELKLFLFRENARLENERKDLKQRQDKLVKERAQFRDEMDLLNHRIVLEKKRLKDEHAFFEKKMQILQDGFKQLDLDRQKLDKERYRFEAEREVRASKRSDYDYDYGPDSLISVLFRGADNPLTLRKRYKDLMKIFHPDNLCGDAELVQLINQEYERRKRAENF